MGDTGDDFNARRAAKQEKRADNREQSAEVLTRAGVVFESKNMGAHLIVQAGASVVDFWPGTGLWIARPLGEKGRGVAKLVRFVSRQEGMLAQANRKGGAA